MSEPGLPFRMSRAPDLNTDGRRPIERVLDQPFMLGLFLPLQTGAWSPSTAPRETSWDFDYNAECAVRAEELGFDLVFGLAQWLGKGGYGGEMGFRGDAMDPLLITAGLAPVTRNIVLISTVHVLYGWHPVHLAKFATTLDHMSQGRWGLNMVTGYKPDEFRMFGLKQMEHDLRYEMAGEFVDMMDMLWQAEENVTHRGHYWQMEDAFVSPKPVYGRPILVNAGTSAASIDYAARKSDIVFITSPAGADPEKACAALPDHNWKIKEAARQIGREVRTIINPHVICRDTDEEAQAQRARIIEQQDPVAADNFAASITGGGKESWSATTREMWVVGGNVHLVGTPERIVNWFVRLREAGCDGVQVNFYDFLPDLDFFGRRVLPLMVEAGLRAPPP